MSATFKVKNKKVDKNKNRILETLDSKHIDMIKEWQYLAKLLLKKKIGCYLDMLVIIML